MTDHADGSGGAPSDGEAAMKARQKRWARIDEIVELALGAPPDRRHAFLRAACGGDTALLEEVESLLEHVDGSDHLFSNLSAALSGGARRSGAATGADPLVGTRVGNYHLKERFSSGMAAVYRAWDLAQDRQVVVKLMPQGLEDEAALEAERRIQREAHSEIVLEHPNVCEVLGGGHTDGGRAFVVLEFCPGQTLHQLIADESLTLRAAIHIVVQLADALATAHALGITHRDVKPSNVIVNEALDVKLLDFGVAKLEGHRLTKTGHVLGTLEYMSPEQLSGQSVGSSSDVWSLGTLLAEASTGRHPFRRGSKRETVAMILSRPDRPEASKYEVTEPLRRIVPDMLEGEPDARPSAAQVRDTLRSILATLPPDE